MSTVYAGLVHGASGEGRSNVRKCQSCFRRSDVKGNREGAQIVRATVLALDRATQDL